MRSLGIQSILARFGAFLFEPVRSVSGDLRRALRLLVSLLLVSLVSVGIILLFVPLPVRGARVALLLGALPLLVAYAAVFCLILILSRRPGLRERDRLSELESRARLLEESLAHRDALLREVHHRAKNNLQVISSLLYLQSRRSPAIAEPLLELQARIRSMSEVYERLYSSDELSRIGLGDYLEELVLHVIDSYGRSGVSLEATDLDRGIFVGSETAVPLGLIVTELVTNSLKHAFPESGVGKIRLKSEARGGQLAALLVGDDGVGMREAAPGAARKGLGMQIVYALAKQIDAKIERVEGPGTVFMIRLPARRTGEDGSPLAQAP